MTARSLLRAESWRPKLAAYSERAIVPPAVHFRWGRRCCGSASSMKWIMLLSGVLTSTMIYAAIAPDAALQSPVFGETLSGPLAQIVVRNWGALIALIGARLIYGAFNPASRPLVLTVAGISKAVLRPGPFHGRSWTPGGRGGGDRRDHDRRVRRYLSLRALSNGPT